MRKVYLASLIFFLLYQNLLSQSTSKLTSNTQDKVKTKSQKDQKTQNRKNPPDLDYVILIGNLNSVKLALKQGADINKVDIFGNTPLINSIFSDKLDIARYLISRGANVNIKNKKGLTPLLIAIYKMGYEINRNRYYALIQDLLKKGANPNIKTINGRSPLDVAKYSFSSQDDRLVEILRIYGAK